MNGDHWINIQKNKSKIEGFHAISWVQSRNYGINTSHPHPFIYSVPPCLPFHRPLRDRLSFFSLFFFSEIMCGAQRSIILNARTMYKFHLKTYREGFSSIKPHFFILSKGLNAGKPLDIPCPNSFSVVTETEEERNFFFWLSTASGRLKRSLHTCAVQWSHSYGSVMQNLSS